MSAIAPRPTALVVLATAGLLFLAAILFGGAHDSVVGPAGAVIMGAFATGCAVNAAWAARSGQRLAWIALATGLGGWAAGNGLWCYVALRGTAPIPASSAAEIGYVMLPLCALGATVLVPNRDDYQYGFGLLLDAILVASSLFLALGSLVVGAADRVSIPRIVLAVITAIYLGLVVIALVVARTAERGRRLSPTLLAAGFAAMGIAGVLNLHENRPDHMPNDVVTLGWLTGTYFFALSAIVSKPGPDLDTARTSHPFLRQSMWLPYLPVSVALVAFAVRFWPPERGDAFIFAAGMVLSVTVLLRQLLALKRKQRLLAEVADAALRDAVTGLANRRLLDERLAHAVQLHVRLAVPVSLLRVRVDDFNVVNDTLGYAASEALLRGVGARIQASVRADDTVARMGGDEFAILVEDRPEVAEQVGKRLARAFDSALDIGDNRVYVHLSIGVATAEPDGAAVTAGDLLDRAEAARSRAEQTSASDVQTFTPEMDAHLGTRQSFRDGIARLQLLWDLRRAIDDRLLTLVYQPQFALATGAVCGAEALLRWEHITLGSLEPGEFLPLVREHGLMDAVTDLVLSRAVADASGWHAAGTAIPVAINIWARSLDEDTLPDRIMSVLDAHGMPANLLTVEITEELVVADFTRGRAVLNRLRDAGIRVSIDDFGSGYSTLTYLRELPIDEVKLDRHLIAPIPYDQRAATIARSVIELAEEFGIASVAEGIENDETVQWLRRFGCDVVQGNYFCGPLPAGEIPQVPSVPTQKV
jgi:diguanylate cyclase (GGDEF)-like protein